MTQCKLISKHDKPMKHQSVCTCVWPTDCVCYRNGWNKPNYPVPAIRLEVDICQTWDNEVHIWDMDSNTSVIEWYNGGILA